MIRPCLKPHTSSNRIDHSHVRRLKRFDEERQHSVSNKHVAILASQRQKATTMTQTRKYFHWQNVSFMFLLVKYMR